MELVPLQNALGSNNVGRVDKTPTWIMNPHGVKSCVPANVAIYKVTKKIGWSYCEPDPVPETKQYPMSIEMTEAGLKRRKDINASNKDVEVTKVEQVAEEGGFKNKDLQAIAKNLNIDRYWLKSVETLQKEISEYSAEEIKKATGE